MSQCGANSIWNGSKGPSLFKKPSHILPIQGKVLSHPLKKPGFYLNGLLLWGLRMERVWYRTVIYHDLILWVENFNVISVTALRESFDECFLPIQALPQPSQHPGSLQNPTANSWEAMAGEVDESACSSRYKQECRENLTVIKSICLGITVSSNGQPKDWTFQQLVFHIVLYGYHSINPEGQREVSKTTMPEKHPAWCKAWHVISKQWMEGTIVHEQGGTEIEDSGI